VSAWRACQLQAESSHAGRAIGTTSLWPKKGPAPLSPLSFGQPKTVSAPVVIINEENSGFFESLLKPHQGRCVTGDLFAFSIRRIVAVPTQEQFAKSSCRQSRRPRAALRFEGTVAAIACPGPIVDCLSISGDLAGGTQNLARRADFPRQRLRAHAVITDTKSREGAAIVGAQSDALVRSRTPGPPPFGSINSIPAASRARRTERSFAAVIEVLSNVSSARRMVVTPTADSRARSSAVHRISARAALICPLVRGLRFMLTFAYCMVVCIPNGHRIVAKRFRQST
jgi:hypothetical protein